MKFGRFVAALGAALVLAAPATAAVIDVGPQEASYDGLTRGYYFTAPVSFTITGVYVPTDFSTGNQSIEVVRFGSAAPPAYPGLTNDFTSLGQWLNDATAGFIATSISVSAGDVIGVYGSRGAALNSYGSAVRLTQIGGQDVTLYRSGMQHALQDGGAHDLWAEAGGRIGRVQFSYEVSAAPEPGTWALMIMGFGGAGVLLRRRQALAA